MRAGTRWGMMAGLAATPFTMRLFYDYQPDMFGPLTIWLMAAAPVALWLAIETAVRLRRRARPVSYALAVAGLVAAGMWGWWLYNLLATGNTTTVSRIGIPVVGVALYTVGAVLSGLSRKPARPVERVEAATQ